MTVTEGPATPRLIRGASWSLLSQIVPVVGGIVLTPFLIHHLGLSRYGLFVLALTVSAFLRAFDGGLGGSAVRYFSIQVGRDDRTGMTRLLLSLLAAVFGVGALVCLLVAGIGPVAVRAFGVAPALRGEADFLLVCVTAMVMVGLAGGVMGAVLIAHLEFAYVSALAALLSIAGLGATVAVVERGDGLRGIGLVLLVQSAAPIALIFPRAARWLDPAVRSFASRQELSEFFRFASKVQLLGLATLITLESDALLVAAIKGTRSVGLYTVGANFASQMRSVTYNALGPITAQFGRSYGARGLDATPDFHAAQRVWVAGVTAWCSACGGAAYVAIVTWLGPGFGITGVVATVLTASYMINLWTGCTTAWLQTTGFPGVEARYAAVCVGTNLVLTAALVFPFGLVGIVIGTAAGQVAASLWLLRLVRVHVPFPVRSFLLDVPVVSGALCAGVTALIEVAMRGFLPEGPLGLVLCGFLALPGLAVFALRERWLLTAVRVR